MVVVWYTVLGPYGLTLGQFLSRPEVELGLTALTAYQLIYISSLASFRQKAYELFLASHIALQVIGLLFLYMHNPGSRVYVGITLAIFVIDRVIYRFWVKRTTVEATIAIMEDDETVKLSTEISLTPRSKISRVLGRSLTQGFQAADHVFVTVPSLGRKYALQSHPLVIASAAPSQSAEVAQLDFLVRARERFSLDLLNHAHKHDRLKLQLDGPYGSSLSRSILADSEVAVLVAGGSGIAVAWPLAQHLLELNLSSEASGAPSFVHRKRKIVIIWVMRKPTHVSWIGQHALDDAERNGADVIIPATTDDHGEPDLEGIL